LDQTDKELAESQQPVGMTAVAADQPSELNWLSPDEAPFQVSGFAWWSSERKYRRLPISARGVVRDELDQLADNTSGGQIRFCTNASKLVVRAVMFAANEGDNMAAIATNGFDCYVGLPGSLSYCGTTRFAVDVDHYESVIFDRATPEMRGITLNFPLYQGVREVYIGVNPEAEVIAYPDYENDERLVFYGTSITQGGCASRPGMSYTNILSRRFDREFINLGFSGNGKGDPEIAQLICEIDRPGCIVVDYDPNNVHAEDLVRTMPEFIRILRSKHPETPILVLSRIPYSYESLLTHSYEDRVFRRDFQRDFVARLREEGDLNIHFYDGADLLGEEWNECTVDGVHPNDLGFRRMADALTPVLEQILA